MLPSSENPAVIRTDFDNEEAWDTMGGLFRAPVYDGDNTFYAYVDLVDDVRYRNQPVGKLLRELPHNYKHSFLRLEDTIELPPGYENGLAQAAILKCIPKAIAQACALYSAPPRIRGEKNGNFPANKQHA